MLGNIKSNLPIVSGIPESTISSLANSPTLFIRFTLNFFVLESTVTQIKFRRSTSWNSRKWNKFESLGSFKAMFRMSYDEKWFCSMYLSSRAVHSKIHKSHEFTIENCDTVVVLCQLLKLGKYIWYLIAISWDYYNIHDTSSSTLIMHYLFFFHMANYWFR